MELRRALTIFRLQKRIPIDSLNSIFRELVKKYHPDKVREHPDWAHERMSEINNAYETLAEWLSKPPEEKKTAHTVTQTGDNTERTDEELFRHEIPTVNSADRKIFYPVFNAFLDGLGVYYQYGLENPAYRVEGIRRFRFREAYRTIKKTRDKLENYSKEKKHPVFLAASRFSRLTAAEIELGEPDFKEKVKYRKFDDRFRLARRSFDDAVKEIFFPELIPKHLTGRAISGIYACYTSFVLYLTVFTEGERRNAAILMTARYDALMDLLELRNNGILEF